MTITNINNLPVTNKSLWSPSHKFNNKIWQFCFSLGNSENETIYHSVFSETIIHDYVRIDKNDTYRFEGLLIRYETN
jgi:hypothetical protein